jgi:pyruvate dehydrogenase E2 component (dihydrolipoamide acetyltransferase)
VAELLYMPEVAANATEAALQEWAVNEGATFEESAVLAVIETDKAVVELEAERAGTLAKVLVQGGQTVAVGAPIAVITDGVEPFRLEELLVGQTGRQEGPAAEESPKPQVEEDLQPPPEATPSAAQGARLFISPLARRLAKEAGLDPVTIAGTGPKGRIRRRDVDAAIASRENSSAAAAPPRTASPRPVPRTLADAQGVRHWRRPVADTPELQAIPHSRMRRAIATRLSASKRDVPHFYLRATPRVDRLMALRTEVNESRSERVSVNDLVVKAAGLALAAVPEMNVSWGEDAVTAYAVADVAVAVATDRGLLTPVVRAVDSTPLVGVAAQLRGLRQRAVDGTLTQGELEGGALTVSNLGMEGVEDFAAIINPPQCAILAVGAVREAAVVEDGQVVPGRVMGLTLSVDHRPVDGVVAARWLRHFVGLLEQPVRILVEG